MATGNIRRGWVWAVAALVGLGAIGLWWSYSAPGTPPEPMSPEERAKATYEPLLRKGLVSDEQCQVNRLFYQGTANMEKFYWSAACENGKSFFISVNGTTGETKYTDCGVAATVGIRCFEAIK
jgi:hypothetical protein